MLDSWLKLHLEEWEEGNWHIVYGRLIFERKREIKRGYDLSIIYDIDLGYKERSFKGFKMEGHKWN